MAGRTTVLALMLCLLGGAMLVPSIHAAMDSEWRIGRAFLYSGMITLFAGAALMVLARRKRIQGDAAEELLGLLLVWSTLPLFACLPIALLIPQIGTSAAWFEMVAALTTTGGTVFSRPEEVAPAIHLWRGMVGWAGGLLTLMGAYVVLEPRRLGGFEILAAADGMTEGRPIDLRIASAPLEARSIRALREILPFYAGATVVLAVYLSAIGQPGLVATIHAMSTVSTSGITPLAHGLSRMDSFAGEVGILIVMAAAATRLSYGNASRIGRSSGWWADAEIRLMVALVLGVTLILFLRHWVAILTVDNQYGALEGFVALWGGLFTALSFLTTTGFVSFAWESARDWSGHANPGLVLLCLCMIGGGAATTVGGLKLIRAYALIRHGTRELDRIASPNAITGDGAGPRGLRREGALIAWTFMMLFLLALMVTVLGLTLTGMAFQDAMIGAIAALSNTGPAIDVLSEERGNLTRLDAAQHFFLATAMILGRIEILAFIALFARPDLFTRQGRKNLSGNSRRHPPSWN